MDLDLPLWASLLHTNLLHLSAHRIVRPGVNDRRSTQNLDRAPRVEGLIRGTQIATLMIVQSQCSYLFGICHSEVQLEPITTCLPIAHMFLNVASESRINLSPLHSNIAAKDWEAEIDRIDISRQTALDGEVEYWIALVGLESKAYFQLRLPDDDDLRAFLEITTDPRPSQSWELLAQYDETGRGRYFADVYVLLRQLGFDRWMLTRGTGEPRRHGLRSWT